MPILQELAYGSKNGIPDQIKEAYDEMLKNAGRKLWQGALKVSAAGFGKGILLAAAAIVLVAVIGTGLSAPTFAMGASAGLAKAFVFLTTGSAANLLTLGIGGALGAASDMVKHHNNVTAEVARAQEMVFERLRIANEARQLQAAQAVNEPATLIAADGAMKEKDCGFCAREMQRREAQANNTYRTI